MRDSAVKEDTSRMRIHIGIRQEISGEEHVVKVTVNMDGIAEPTMVEQCANADGREEVEWVAEKSTVSSNEACRRNNHGSEGAVENNRLAEFDNILESHVKKNQLSGPLKITRTIATTIPDRKAVRAGSSWTHSQSSKKLICVGRGRLRSHVERSGWTSTRAMEMELKSDQDVATELVAFPSLPLLSLPPLPSPKKKERQPEAQIVREQTVCVCSLVSAATPQA